jgi:hypothetical protein
VTPKDGSSDEAAAKAAALRAKRIANLKPFKPGQSGNPKGLPKGYWAKAREAAERADPFRYLVQTVLGENPKATEDIRLRAAQEILNRAYGKPLDTQVQLRIGEGSDAQAGQLGGALEALARVLSGGNAPLLVDGQVTNSVEMATETATLEADTEPNDP